MRRVSAEKPLNTMNDADFLEPSFSSGISRRILLRETKETESNICGGKSRISNRTIPCNEAISRPLQSDYFKMVIQVLSHRPEIKNSPIDVILAGDSLCTASLYNRSIVIKNVLIRGSVATVKERWREILNLLPQSNIYLTWLEGKYKTADASSNLFFNQVEVINTDLYRHGPKGLTDINSGIHTIFYKVNSQG